MRCGHEIEKLQNENRTKEHEFYARATDKMLGVIKQQKNEIEDLREKVNKYRAEVEKAREMNKERKEEEMSSVEMLKSMRKEAVKLEKSFGAAEKKLFDAQVKENKALKEQNENLSRKLGEMEMLLNTRNDTTVLDKDDHILYKAKISEKENTIKKQTQEIDKYKSEIEKLKEQLDKKVDSDMFAPGSSVLVNPYDKTLIAAHIKDTPKRINTVKGKINVNDLFDTTMVEQPVFYKKKNTEDKPPKEEKKVDKKSKAQRKEDTDDEIVRKIENKRKESKNKNKQPLNEVAIKPKTVKRKVTEPKETKKVKTLLENENKSYFQDLSFGNTSPIDFNKKSR